jgi:transcription elongation factor Elf1
MATKIKRRHRPGFVCSFCGKKNKDVEVLVVSKEGSAKICDSCIVSGIQVCIGRRVDVVSRAMDQIKEAYDAVDELMAADGESDEDDEVEPTGDDDAGAGDTA